MPASWDKWVWEKGCYQGPELCFLFWLWSWIHHLLELHILYLLNLVFIYLLHFYNRFNIPQNNSVYLVPAPLSSSVCCDTHSNPHSCWIQLSPVGSKPPHSSNTACCNIIFVCRSEEYWSLVFVTTLGCGFFVWLVLIFFCVFN